jgi:ubiquinol-cytochrome c reductase cytochrome b/c1 subunit
LASIGFEQDLLGRAMAASSTDAHSPSPSALAMRRNRLVRWIDYRLPFVASLDHHVFDYPTPVNLSYWWNFGSLAGIILVIMIITGITLAMYYTPDSAMAFDSVERIMRDVNYGWLIRYIHMNGASAFFLIVYIHLFRGLYYGSYKYPRELLWILGVIILLLMIATAFMGYVLPWGQMSYWAATVITNLFSAIPVIGHPLVTLLWGGYVVGDPTLHRFFSLHYLLPFIIVAVIGLHLLALHQHGSNNPLGIDKRGPQDTIPFHPYHTIKDMFGLSVFLLLFALVVFYIPNYLVEPDNYIPANPLQTPPHIVPEWYLLPFYAILRSITFTIFGIPAKLLGVIAAFGAMLILFFVPWLDTSPVRSSRFRPVYRWVFWLLPISLIALGYVGSQPPQGWIVTLGQVGTAYYYIHFLILLPLLGKLERPLPLPISIAAAVLGSREAAAAVAGERH